MSKFELSINVKYLPEWGVWEGIRELIQNGKDAEVEHNAPLTVDWKNGTLRIENEGALLTREALLFGTTSKGGRADLIGKFGEGLKLGVLALVRAGRSVTIRSGGEVWEPTIARSEKYDADVLVFDIKTGREEKKRVRVEIDGVIESEWLDFRNRFLFLKDKRESNRKHIVSTWYGDLLLHERNAGKLYCKGIYVCDANTRFGYNFKDAELDRDRKMIADYDRRAKMGYILNEAANIEPTKVLDSYISIVESPDSEEGKGINEYRLPAPKITAAIVKRFKEKHGDNAVPVRSLAESQDVEHFGVRGVVVSEALAAILKKDLGNAETTKSKFANSTLREFSYGDLTHDEKAALFNAIDKVSCGNASLLDGSNAYDTKLRKRIAIVEFRDANLNGLHHGERIEIARKMLADEFETLRVLVHELAHDAGSDGDKSHVAQIERTWANIARYLSGKAVRS